jgi:hypothetical protein
MMTSPALARLRARATKLALTKFNPNHGPDGKFTSGSGGSAAGDGNGKEYGVNAANRRAGFQQFSPELAASIDASTLRQYTHNTRNSSTESIAETASWHRQQEAKAKAKGNEREARLRGQDAHYFEQVVAGRRASESAAGGSTPKGPTRQVTGSGALTPGDVQRELAHATMMRDRVHSPGTEGHARQSTLVDHWQSVADRQSTRLAEVRSTPGVITLGDRNGRNAMVVRARTVATRSARTLGAGGLASIKNMANHLNAGKLILARAEYKAASPAAKAKLKEVGITAASFKGTPRTRADQSAQDRKGAAENRAAGIPGYRPGK